MGLCHPSLLSLPDFLYAQPHNHLIHPEVHYWKLLRNNVIITRYNMILFSSYDGSSALPYFWLCFRHQQYIRIFLLNVKSKSVRAPTFSSVELGEGRPVAGRQLRGASEGRRQQVGEQRTAADLWGAEQSRAEQPVSVRFRQRDSAAGTFPEFPELPQQGRPKTAWRLLCSPRSACSEPQGAV